MVLLKASSPLLLFERTIKKRMYNWFNEGIQYPGFKYYPKNSDFKDPPYEATKLFRIQRIKPMKGCPYWEKDMLKEFRIDGKLNDFAIVKNIPEINARLWRIKHLIKIIPIKFPDGFPKDPNGTYLKENGELIVSHKLKPVESRMNALTKFEEDPKRLDGGTLRRESRKKWNDGMNTI